MGRGRAGGQGLLPTPSGDVFVHRRAVSKLSWCPSELVVTCDCGAHLRMRKPGERAPGGARHFCACFLISRRRPTLASPADAPRSPAPRRDPGEPCAFPQQRALPPWDWRVQILPRCTRVRRSCPARSQSEGARPDLRAGDPQV